MAAITGVGATALNGVAESPIVPNEPGFIRRRWDAIKTGVRNLNPRNSPAAQAAIAAGQEFSKWDLAKASIGEAVSGLALVGSMTSNFLAMGYGIHYGKDQVANKASARLDRRFERLGSGTSNPVLRKKMAAALLENRSNSAPVNEHLWRYSKAVTGDVRQTQDYLRWREQNLAKINGAKMIGSAALGLSVSMTPLATHAAEAVARLF
ncbi:MAG TPA: hypothetical protein VLF69_00450 [Candidatus Saccharimonadales bacterium]|nr:hypothetical protein [Candidatus Saccharimonadales bacterium]